MKKSVILLLVVVLALSAVVPVVYGDELEDLRNQQQQVDRQIQQYRQEIQNKNRELKSLSQQMEELDRNIAAVEKDLDSLQSQLEAAIARVEQVQRELNQAEANLRERTDVFRKRLVEIYHQGDVNYLEVLMESTSMTDFLVRMELLQKIAEYDLKLLDEIEAEKAAIEAKKAELEQERDQIRSVKQETEAKKNRLAQQQEEKTKLANALKTEKEAIERALKEEEEASQRLAAQIRAIQAKRSGNSQYTGGKMAWPAPGYTRITDDYGMRVHPVLKQKKLHTGVDIGAPMGAQVVAAENGEVILAQFYGAYGNTVLIDHGGNVVTLYGHLSSISVKVGDQVLRGDPIGKVGSTGLSTGPHLHFEVRENGDPVNPWTYLK